MEISALTRSVVTGNHAVIAPDGYVSSNITGWVNCTANVIINEAMVRIYFPDEDPMGKKLVIQMSDNPVPSEIIGVVRDVKHQGLDIEPRAMTYWPHP